MEPRAVWGLLDGELRRRSWVSELVAWGVWQIVMSMPFTKADPSHRYFKAWLKANTPPWFIPPTKE